MTSISVLGVGRVGGQVAYLSAMLGLADEFVMYDAVPAFLNSQVLDLKHTGLDIPVSTDWRSVKKSDICIFSAGLPRNPDVKTRADLLQANLPVAFECSQVLKNYEGILITVTNPMDANNYYLCRKNGIDSSRCIGFGGQLDSARFGLELKKRRIPGKAYVLGDHGEFQVPLFSRLKKSVPVPLREEILTQLRGASMEIIKGKGGTVFGPAYHIVDLVRAIVEDKKATKICSCILDGEYGLSGCSLGVPVKVGRDGISEILEWKLDAWERTHFENAGEFVTGLCAQLGV